MSMREMISFRFTGVCWSCSNVIPPRISMALAETLSFTFEREVRMAKSLTATESGVTNTSPLSSSRLIPGWSTAKDRWEMVARFISVWRSTAVRRSTWRNVN